MFNKQDHICATIESVFRQSYTDYEVILVNDGSTDQSPQSIYPYLNRIQYVEQDNAGPSSARNRGIGLARGKYIAFLDADDIWYPDKLARQVSYMESHPHVQWSGVNGAIKGAQSTRPDLPTLFPYSRAQRGEWRTFDDWFSISALHNVTPTPGVIVRRHVFDSVGFFDTSIPSGQDRDMWIRIACGFPLYGFFTAPLITILFHLPGSISIAGEAKHRSMLLYIEKHLKQIESGFSPSQSYVDYIRLEAHTLIRRSLALGYPRIARDLFRILPRTWVSPLWQIYRPLVILPSALLRFLFQLRHFAHRVSFRK